MGAACVRALAERGDRVVAAARRADALATATEGLETVDLVVADVGTAAGRAAIVDAAVSASRDTVDGCATSVIHGAATAVAFDPWLALDPDELTAHFHVHVAAAVALTGELHRRPGLERCVIFDSYSATTPRVGWSAYSILKTAAQMAFRAAADELPDLAIARVYPGAVSTPLLDRVLGASRDIEATHAFHELNDTGRVSTPDEIAEQLLPILDLRPAEIQATDTWTIGHPV